MSFKTSHSGCDSDQPDTGHRRSSRWRKEPPPSALQPAGRMMGGCFHAKQRTTRTNIWSGILQSLLNVSWWIHFIDVLSLGNTPCCYDYFYYYSKKAAGLNPNFALIFLLSLYVLPVDVSSIPVLPASPHSPKTGRLGWISLENLNCVNGYFSLDVEPVIRWRPLKARVSWGSAPSSHNPQMSTSVTRLLWINPHQLVACLWFSVILPLSHSFVDLIWILNLNHQHSIHNITLFVGSHSLSKCLGPDLSWATRRAQYCWIIAWSGPHPCATWVVN